MHDHDIHSEFNAENHADRAAYARLTARQRLWARRIALSSYATRQVLVGGVGSVVGIAEVAFNVLFVLPYRALGRGAAWAAKKGVTLAKASIGGVTNIARLGLKLTRWGVVAGLFVAKKANERTPRTIYQRIHQSLGHALPRLDDATNSVIAWGARVKKALDTTYDDGKSLALKSWHWMREAGEYYGAIGLFRVAKAAFNPRIPWSKKFKKLETAGKFLGFAIAGVAFTGLAASLLSIGLYAKIWHIQLAAEFVTDTSQWPIKFGKQALIHPAITLGLTAVKFTALPLIAAARKSLKSFDFTRGIAHAYKTHLKMQDRAFTQKVERTPVVIAAALSLTPQAVKQAAQSVVTSAPVRLSVIFAKAAAEKISAPIQRSWLARNFKKVSMAQSLNKFVTHIIDAAAPSYYEGRHNFYRGKQAAKTFLRFG